MFYIKTATGFSGLANGKPFTVQDDHPNFDFIKDAIRLGSEHEIEKLINLTYRVATDVDTPSSNNELYINTEAGIVAFSGHEVVPVLAKRLLDMMDDGFDIAPMSNFIRNLYQNPSKKTIDRIYEWMEAGKMPITDDGCFLAYKRVDSNYMSFYDNTTSHKVGEYVEMPRFQCDDRSEQTCSTGLHFCSHEYLSSYYGGQGRVLLLKINPADVVSIPTDYGTSKGRACRYLVLSELDVDTRETVETVNPLESVPVYYVDDRDINGAAIKAYRIGYYNGRNGLGIDGHHFDYGDEVVSYECGYKDGKGHKKRVY
jgi:hypothetical protein